MGVEVEEKEDGVVISIDGYEVNVTVRSPGLTVEEVKSALGEYEDVLSISEEDEGIVVQPVSYLGKEKFATIASEVRELGGEYVSAGKESRFIIKKK